MTWNGGCCSDSEEVFLMSFLKKNVAGLTIKKVNNSSLRF